MAKVLGFLNLHNCPKLGLLSENHPTGAVTFLGRYGLMDFTLSNFSNSGIDKICILADSKFTSLRTHVGDGQVYINNTKTGYVKLLINEKDFSNPRFNTDVRNIINNREDLLDKEVEYVVFAPVHFLMSYNFNEAINEHIQSGHDISLLYSYQSETERFEGCDTLKIGAGALVKELGPKCLTNFVSLQTYIMRVDKYRELISLSQDISTAYGIDDLVRHFIVGKEFSVGGIEVKKHIVPILSLQGYFNESMNLLKYSERQKLFFDEWPVYTTTHDTPPTHFGKHAKVSNCFIANGGSIRGEVTNSIISRNVIIDEGAKIDHCIIFTHSIIGKDTKLSYILTDKNVSVSDSQEITGKNNNVTYIEIGAKV